ncbi:hypothetical protein QJS10_CPB13g01268 [Acorus calamus]|uniref:Reverse transcriptase domain-containing protein n=1 Tax=Acorus calamus TaxID=4465 RepID=A0AAV9DGG9_ACOCL|nr:hypothetical protein QJS10_CPB13g01268 [Acorus calamus]
MEETEWRQRSRELWLKEGDNNTKFFYKAANQRRRSNHIGSINIDGYIVEEPHIIEQTFVDFSHMHLISKPRRWQPEWRDEDNGRIPDHMWPSIEALFSVEEVKKAVLGAEADKALGPDDFQNSLQGIGALNVTFLSLIPKKVGATELGDFRPISLVNGSFKLVAKVLANRLKLAINSMVDDSQSAFIPGRLLQDGFMAVQECIFAVHKDKCQGILIKLDFARALIT